MPLTYAGYLSKPLKLLQDLICASATFRTAVGAANATAATAFVFWDEAFPSDSRPWVVIAEGDRSSVMTSVGSWEDEGQLVALFEFPAEFDGQHQTNEGPVGFRNQIEAIESEMKAAIRANASTYLELQQIDGPRILPPQPKDCDGELFYTAFFTVHYKGDGS